MPNDEVITFWGKIWIIFWIQKHLEFAEYSSPGEACTLSVLSTRIMTVFGIHIIIFFSVVWGHYDFTPYAQLWTMVAVR